MRRELVLLAEDCGDWAFLSSRTLRFGGHREPMLRNVLSGFCKGHIWLEVKDLCCKLAWDAGWHGFAGDSFSSICPLRDVPSRCSIFFCSHLGHLSALFRKTIHVWREVRWGSENQREEIIT